MKMMNELYFALFGVQVETDSLWVESQVVEE
jgi:hypothetical protein